MPFYAFFGALLGSITPSSQSWGSVPAPILSQARPPHHCGCASLDKRVLLLLDVVKDLDDIIICLKRINQLEDLFLGVVIDFFVGGGYSL